MKQIIIIIWRAGQIYQLKVKEFANWKLEKVQAWMWFKQVSFVILIDFISALPTQLSSQPVAGYIVSL